MTSLIGLLIMILAAITVFRDPELEYVSFIVFMMGLYTMIKGAIG